MSTSFNEKWYIQSKLKQCQESGQKDANGNDYTAATLTKAIKNAGFTLEEHYQKYSSKEGTSAYTQTNFDEDYYLKSKLAQLNAKGETDANGNAYTRDSLIKAIQKAGMTVEQHFQKYSTSESTSANAYFNTSEYLAAKLEQLQNSANASERAQWAGKSVDDVAAAIKHAGMSAEEHYRKYGCKEVDKDGNLINPSNAFDANAYASAKLAQLQKDDPETWGSKNAQDVMNAITKAGLSPVAHYERYGAEEANAAEIAMVQTVPVVDRVSNDSLRNMTNDNVPANYNPSTAAPKSVTSGTEVTKPADVGSLASSNISPTVAKPAAPVSTPSDVDYVAVPGGGIHDTNENPVELVSVSTQDALGNTVTVSQYGITTNANGTFITKAVGSDGKLTSDAVTIKTVSGNTTVCNVKDIDGNQLSQTVTVNGNTSSVSTSGTLSDGAKVTYTATVKGNTTTSETTITSTDGTKVVSSTTTTQQSDGSISTQSTAKSYDSTGKLTGSTEYTIKEVKLADGSLSTKVDAVNKDASGSVTGMTSTTSKVVTEATGHQTTTTDVQVKDASGAVLTTTNEVLSKSRGSDGALTTSQEVTTKDAKTGEVTSSEVTQKISLVVRSLNNYVNLTYF